MQLASLAHFIQLLRRSAIHTLRVKFSFWAIPLEAWILGVVDQRWHLWQARIEFSRYHQNWWWIYIYNIILGDLQSWSPFSLVDYSYPSGVILWDIVMEKRLSFTPSALFMLGSPLGVFLHTGYGVAGSHALCKKLGKAWSSNAFLHVNSFPFKLRGNLFTTFSAFQKPFSFYC